MSRMILVADDEDDILELVQARLSKRGYDVLTAKNGQEALAILARRQPDLVLVDYRMPDVDGTEVCRHIKGDPRLRHIPVILLTASPGRFTPAALLDAQFDDRLAKPFDATQLLDTVERHLGGRP